MKDKTKLLHERALMTCVIMLFLCIILKLFGVQWFDLDTNILIVKEIDDFLITYDTASYFVTLIFKMINAFLMCMIITKDIKKIRLIPLLILTNVSMLLSYFEVDSFLRLLYDFVSLILYSKIFLKCEIKEAFCVFVLNVLYQFISLFIRNVGIHIQSNGFVVSFLLSLDYYVMLILTFLYVKKGGVTVCGVIFHSFSSLPSRLWRRHSTVSERFSKSKER